MITSSKNTINSCRICSSSSFSDLFNIESFPLFYGAITPKKKKDDQQYPLSIAICNDCGLVQQLNLLDEEIINRVYDADYHSCPSPVATGIGIGEIEKFHSFFNQNSLNKGKLLELACFDGYLLKKIQKDGWDVFGCDPSPTTKTAADLIGKKRIVNDYFHKDLYPSNLFDVIVFRNLLEHIYDLHEFIRSISFSLKIGGRIFVEVPNVKEYVKYGGVGSFFHQHVSYFSLKTLTHLLTKHGFTIERFHEGNPNLFVQAVKRELNDKKQFKPGYKIIGIDQQSFIKKHSALLNEIIKYFNEPNYKKIALFCASAFSTYILSFLKPDQTNKISYIFDNDKNKQGKEIIGCNVSISNPNEINTSSFDSILITTYLFHNEIRQQLQDFRIESGKIISISDFVAKI